MSFRNRLALFFVVIVIVPMLAVTFLLFRLIERSETGQAEAAIAQQVGTAAKLLDEQRGRTGAALDAVGRDRVFRESLRDGDLDRAQRRAAQLAKRPAITRIVFIRRGEVLVDAGRREAVAPLSQEVQSSAGEEFGSLQVAGTDAATYAARARKLTGLHVVVVNGSRLLAGTLPVTASRLPTKAGAEATIDGVEYRVQSSPVAGFTGQRIRVSWLGSIAGAKAELKTSPSGSRAFVGVVLAGFLLLALACAALVSRTLQRQIAEFLAAAQRLAGGDFSARVPTVGRDEFAQLGEEFNKMSRELEGRLGELRQERERVQGSMRRLGEAVAANLDRDALLELVVKTAVDGVGADAGRAQMRVGGLAALQERSRVGDINGLEPALATVEADAFASGRPHEATVGHATAMAYPLRGADGGGEGLVGVVSIGRSGRPFSTSERELLAYLTSQAARSLENVERHETAARESVTDDLTGLANRRAFDDGLAGEIERAKRFDSDLGLVLIDLDNFKSINDTYGHLQGDLVLREVAGVLRDSSREIDLPARYGGEELAVVLPGTDLDGAFHRSERVRAQIAALRIARLDGNGVLNVTASCGVGAVRGESADIRGLVQAADNALYEAKRSGKNKSVQAR